MRALAHDLGRIAAGPCRLYLVGGASAVMEGWHPSTIDIDLRLEPDTDELYEAIEPPLFRYPAVDSASFRRRVERATHD